MRKSWMVLAGLTLMAAPLLAQEPEEPATAPEQDEAHVRSRCCACACSRIPTTSRPSTARAAAAAYFRGDEGYGERRGNAYRDPYSIATLLPLRPKRLRVRLQPVLGERVLAGARVACATGATSARTATCSSSLRPSWRRSARSVRFSWAVASSAAAAGSGRPLPSLANTEHLEHAAPHFALEAVRIAGQRPQRVVALHALQPAHRIEERDGPDERLVAARLLAHPVVERARSSPRRTTPAARARQHAPDLLLRRVQVQHDRGARRPARTASIHGSPSAPQERRDAAQRLLAARPSGARTRCAGSRARRSPRRARPPPCCSSSSRAPGRASWSCRGPR